jgi:hypothetical protein
MGCTLSDSATKFDFETSYREKYHKLFQEHAQLVKYIENDLGSSSHDQINILKYKIELLLTMLAMEEKSKDVISKRIETMKWMLVSQGKSEQQIEELFSNYRDKNHTFVDLDCDIEISSAIEKMQLFFKESRGLIIESLADEHGNIILHLPRETFITELESISNLSRKDLQVFTLL